jgi:hypothetical protein
MDAYLLLIFAVLGAFTSCLELFKRKSGKGDPTDRAFLRFRHNYVLVYAFMMGAFTA